MARLKGTSTTALTLQTIKQALAIPVGAFNLPISGVELDALRRDNSLDSLRLSGKVPDLSYTYDDAVDETSQDSALKNISHPVYGDGFDGAQNFDGTATVLGLAPSSHVYTLTRDIFLADGSALAAIATIKEAGFRIFCNGGFALNGNVNDDGAAGAAAVAGAARSAGYYGATKAGGAGHTGPGAGSNGAASATTLGAPRWSTQVAAVAGANGAGNGQGGGGGSAGADAGGTGGAITAIAATKGGFDSESMLTGNASSDNSALSYGSGGGGGGCVGGASGVSGGGGAGGGYAFVAAKKLTGTGSITAKGGAGAAATLGDSTGAGGGAGGGGGIAVAIYDTNGGVTLSAAGGAGGAGAGTGMAGGNGSAGSTVTLNLSGDGT